MPEQRGHIFYYVFRTKIPQSVIKEFSSFQCTSFIFSPCSKTIFDPKGERVLFVKLKIELKLDTFKGSE